MTRRWYIENRLYSANWRLQALDLGDMLDGWIDTGIFADMGHCFLPFRDDEHSDNEKQVFESDLNAINASQGIVGYFDGATADSGCAFEIGYGFSRGYPINLISTNLQKFSQGDGSKFYFVSKLTNYIAKIAALNDVDSTISGYREQQEDLLQRVFNILRNNLIEDFGTVKPLVPLPVIYDYYLDPNFAYTNAGRQYLDTITNTIDKAGKSYILGNNRDDIGADIGNLLQSNRAILLSDTNEADIDSGILQGICYGIGCNAITLCTKQGRYIGNLGSGYLNCMISYSAYRIAYTTNQLVEIINGTPVTDFVLYDDSEPTIEYADAWIATNNDQNSYKGTLHHCNENAPEQQVNFSFFGTQFEVIGNTSPDYGRMDVYLDGNIVGTVDQYSAVPASTQVSFISNVLDLDIHNVRMVPNGKNPAATGTSVNLDAIGIIGELT